MARDSSAPKVIALVITDLTAGGAARIFVELATGLQQIGYAPKVFCLMPPPEVEKAALVDLLHGANIPVEFLNARAAWHAPIAIFKLTRRFRQLRPELVQSFLFHANLFAAIAGWLAGVPRCFTGIRVAEPRRWHLRLARWTDSLVTTHVCVSESVAEYCRQVAGLPPEKLVVIHNGVDVARFDKCSPLELSSLGVAKGRRVITFVGRLDAQKGVGWLLRVVGQIFDRFPQHDLLIVGQGSAADSLWKLTNELDLGNRVHFAGWRADIPAILAASDALVLPSDWEGMPNVLLEAMAAGKPVVAADVEGVREILGPLAEKQVFCPRVEVEFLTRTVGILEAPELAEEIGRRNRGRALCEFDLRRMVEAYDRLYRAAP